MKNYFGFTLSAKQLLPVWLIFYALFIIPYVLLIFQLKNIQPGTPPSGMIFLYLFLLILAAFSITFYFTKLTIENVQYNNKPITFNGTFGKYFGVMLGGFLLSIITLGIYSPWFIRNICRFFVDNSVYENEPFSFKGKGGKLFLIITFSLLIPIIILSVILAKAFVIVPGQFSLSFFLTQQALVWLIMIPYIYLVYKWEVNIDYKNFNLTWDTKFLDACGKLALELFLTFITLGIYYPMAMMKLYSYFTHRTILISADSKKIFGFEEDHINDFLFIWGQLLLSLITLGIYYPWMISKVGSRILSRTYIESN